MAMSPLRFVETTALHLGYYELGEGPAVVLLQGFPYDIHAYSSVAPALAVEGYRVVVPYMRGFGATQYRTHHVVRSGEQP